MTGIIGHGLASKHTPDGGLVLDADNPTQAACHICGKPACWAHCRAGHDDYVCPDHITAHLHPDDDVTDD